MKMKKAGTDLTGALAYLEGNMNYLQEANDRHSRTAQEVIDETVNILHLIRMGLYKDHRHFQRI
jgi:hypothetical protein